MNHMHGIHLLNIEQFFSRRRVIDEEEKRSTIVRYSILSKNEATLSYKIKKIPYYHRFFHVLDDIEEADVEIDQPDDMNTASNIDYYIFKYNDKNAINLTDWIYSATSIRKLVAGVIDSFQHLLEGLLVLHQNQIGFFDISPQHILFLQNAREKPVWSDFRYSIQLNKLTADDHTYLLEIVKRIQHFTYMPFELHVLYYVIQHDVPFPVIDEAFVRDFCDEYIENMPLLRLFSTTFKTNYTKLCIGVMNGYIRKDASFIIKDIVERKAKWDVYGFSLIYIHIFGCMINTYELKHTFLNEILHKLLVNLHPDSTKRLGLEETKTLFHKYLNESTMDWKFINKIEDHSMATLFEEFSK